MSEAYKVCGPRGERLYPSPMTQASKYRPRRSLARDMKAAVTQFDHAELVTNCTQIICATPILSAAVRQMTEWAFAGDSFQPIHAGVNEVSGSIAEDWLLRDVFPNCVRRTTHKSLIKGMQVSARGWIAQGDDLALFSEVNGMPMMTIIPGTCIGNGDKSWWAGTSVTSGTGWTNPSGFGTCLGGKFDGYRIYNGIIFDDTEEPIAARVLGWKKSKGSNSTWDPAYNDFELGFQHGAHLASPYDWHGMGRAVPRLSAQVPDWLDFRERDDLFQKGIKLAASKTVIHKLREGQDAVEARGDSATQIKTTDANGEEMIVWVEETKGGDVTYIGSGEELEGMAFENPHPNVEDFAVRKARECLSDLGWPYELTDLNSSGRAASRTTCELVNNSLWQLQVIGEVRMDWFAKYAVAVGLKNGKIPPWTSGPLDDPYQWTFGYPREMTVDAGNDLKAWLDMLRIGITSQRIGAGRLGHILKKVRRDRLKEGFALIDDAKALVDYAKTKAQYELPFQKAMEFFYQPSASPAQVPNEAKAESGNQKAESGGTGGSQEPPKPGKSDA